MTKQIGLTGFQLKLIALLGMIFDHINTYFGSELGFPLWFSWIGRFVAPIFLYMMAEGYRYTKNKKAYFNRLLLGTLIMYGINISKNLITGHYVHPVTGNFDLFYLRSGHNIFQTLMLFFVVFILIDRFKVEKKFRKYSVIVWFILLLPFIMMSEGGLELLPLAIVFAWFKNKKSYVIGILLVTSLLWFVKAIIGYYDYGHEYQTLYQHLTYDNQFMQIIALPMIWLYNGQKGVKGAKWEKYLFYFAYPIHLVIIYIISSLL
ncbi:TraX family protein [Streptococcus fryi]